jgi:hypothetical protein
MKMNVEISEVKKISKQPSPLQVMTDQKQHDNVVYFNYLGGMIKMMQDVEVKLNLRLS